MFMNDDSVKYSVRGMERCHEYLCIYYVTIFTGICPERLKKNTKNHSTVNDVAGTRLALCPLKKQKGCTLTTFNQ